MSHQMGRLNRREEGLKRARKLWHLWGFKDMRMVYTRKPCSCWMCGHRRRLEGLTYQERKAILDGQDRED